ncbi:MAG: His-Xaa-Ser system-associated MauG-like protein [Limisphaerales bacterium]
MKSVTSKIAAGLILGLALHGPACADAFEQILRTAALKNGLLPVDQLFDDRDAKLADVGKLFFESENVSLNGGMACRTCHLDEFGSADGLPNAVGVFGENRGPDRAKSDGRIVPRNTLPLWGRGAKGFDVFFWDGKVDFSNGRRLSQFGDQDPSADPLVTAAHLPAVEIREMIVDDDLVGRHKAESQDSASELYTRIFERLILKEPEAVQTLSERLSRPIEQLSFLDVARALASFIRSDFRLRDTKFHQFVFGPRELTEDELAGGIIFYGKGKCVNCHHGPYFSDFDFHAIPFPQLGFGKNGFGVDYGRFNVTFDSEDLYRFRTPPLFNVLKTAPYGHSGSLPDVGSAVRAHFDPLRGVEPSKMSELERHEFFRRIAKSGEEFINFAFLSDSEIEKLVAFLGTLSMESHID